jgi:succinate dehydrogenase flavin-adding protein (antitoxin of CptAB toxin-antitoxin module)
MQALDQLLQLPDNDLLDMVMQRQACTDARIGALLQMLHAL